MGKNMKVGLFSFDGPLYKDINGNYCNVTLTNEMFSRYFTVVDKLVIMVRTFQTNKTYKEMKMKILDTANMEVVEVNNFNTIKGFLIERNRFKKIATQYVERADLIFARMPSNISDLVLKIALKKNKPYLVEVGGCAWDSYWNHGLLGKFIAPRMYFKEKYFVSKANFAIYVTKSFLQNRYPNKNSTINCSNVYINNRDESIIKERLKKINNLNPSHITIGQAVNSIDVKYKGEHLIIKAIRKLNKIGVRVEYQVVGPGEGSYLIKLAKKTGVYDQLKLLGTMTKEQINKWYKTIDFYIQPSKQEGLPRAVIEAMSFGCPALGSKIAGIPELLDNECMFNPNKQKEIVERIKWIIKLKNMKDQALRNFAISKKYNINTIEKNRQIIFNEFSKLIDDI